MTVHLLAKRGVEAAIPVLLAGEFGFTTDTHKLFVGDGAINRLIGPTAVFAASGPSHAPGSVPDPGATAGSTRYLCENATWAVPPGGSGGGVTAVTGTAPIASSGGTAPNISHNASGVIVGTYNSVTVDSFGHVTTASNVAYLTGNQTITLSGDVTGSGTTAIPATLAALSPNPAGSFIHSSITVDAKGRVTAASSGTAPVTSVTGTAPIVSSGGTTPAISINTFVASGASHAAGSVPDPGATASTSRFLREDATWQAPSAAAATITPGLVQGRLSTTSGNPVPGDVTAANVLYFTPYAGDQISLYNGTTWVQQTFSEVSLNLNPGVTVGNVYDVFLYLAGATLTLELVVWTNTTTRATALAKQDGVYVKSGSPTHLYLGTLYGYTNYAVYDTAINRNLWNYYNRITRKLLVTDATTSWTYNGNWRQARANSANQLGVVVGVAEDVTSVAAHSYAYIVAIPAGVNIGINNATPAADTNTNANTNSTSALYVNIHAHLEHVAAGLTNYLWLESSFAGGTPTFYGGSGGGTTSGLIGTVRC